MEDDQSQSTPGIDKRTRKDIREVLDSVAGIADTAPFSVDDNGCYQTGIFKNDVRVIHAEKVIPYLANLQIRLGKTKSMINDTRYSIFVDRILSAYALLQLKFESQRNGYTELPFFIDPTDSGLPHFGNFQFILDDKKNASQELTKIGSLENLLKQASDKISREIFPTEEQILLSNYEYFTKIKETEPLNIIEIGNLAKEEHKKTDKENAYKLEWWGIDSRCSGFVLYKMNFTMDAKRGEFSLAKQQEFSDIMKGHFLQPLDMVFFKFDSINYIHPKKISRFLVGPYYTEHSLNTPNTDALFAFYNEEVGSKDDEPFMLQVTKEKIESLGSRKKYEQFFDALLHIGNKNLTEIPSKVSSRESLLTNFRIKQILSSTEDYGTFSNLYGLTKQGELV